MTESLQLDEIEIHYMEYISTKNSNGSLGSTQWDILTGIKKSGLDFHYLFGALGGCPDRSSTIRFAALCRI